MRSLVSLILTVLTLASTQALAVGAPSAPLIHEGVVGAPADAVWAALTTKEGQESWMVAHSKIDLRIGGRMLTHYDPKGEIGDAKTIENTILSFEPSRMFSIKVSAVPAGFPFPVEIKEMWTVIYLSAEAPASTRVRIVGMGFGEDENSQKMRQFFDRGNAYTLQKLQERFAPKPTPR
jgi:uncharacterized protein YndB with AHSA1/START domain